MLRISGYKYTESGIEYPSNKLSPTYLYKYYSLSKNNIDAFLKGYLFASHPLQLNDIKDSRHTLFKFKYKPDKSLYKQLNQLHVFEIDETGELLKAYFWKTQSLLMGVISLTTSDTNDLMWPHYTKEYGFVIKFNSESLLNSLKTLNQFEIFSFAPVNYVKNVCRASILPSLENLRAANYYMVNVKNKLWSYEDEWRIFISRDGMCPPFDHYYYKKDFNFLDTEEECLNLRKVKYNPAECVDKIIWGSEFIASIGESVPAQNGWAAFSIHEEKQDEFNMLKRIEKEFPNRFFISSLRINHNKINICRRILNAIRNEVEESKIERFSAKFDLKIEGRIVFVRLSKNK